MKRRRGGERTKNVVGDGESVRRPWVGTGRWDDGG